GNGNGSLIGGGRDGWAGLRGSFGTVALGFQGRPWKTLSHALDPFEGTIADYSNVLGRGGEGDAGFDTGIGNSIIWFGPNLGGFTWHAQYGAEDSDGGANNFGLQGNYSNDRFLVGASYDENENTGAGGDDNTALKILGSVNFGNVTITGAYEQLEGVGFVNNADRDAFWLAGTVNLGHGSIRASFTAADDADNATAAGGGGADQFSLGYFGDLSDNATWYVIYSQIDNDSNGNYGFRSDPSTSSLDASLTGVQGEDSDAIAVGIKYNFAADLI
ncbi:MAG: porin, partial [Gammaproteobacteria bacterium]|nr:porin [Gammaproteobacteria bacterium]